ncbi:MAG: biopolymer transporter ExbD [Candidatus Brocadiia bacterium]|jgi:biopolymer transport protein ExbD
MKILSPLPRKRGRLEIIPLIDIMFFLLASFMMVSLTMQHLMSISVSLPTATQAKSTAKPDMIVLTVDRFGQVSMDGKAISFPDLSALLSQRAAADPNYPVYIQGQKETTHASMIYVLDFVKRAGIQKVAFSVKLAPSNF